MNVATIISYCTNEYRFIHKCIQEAQRFSSQVIVVVFDHFFDGTPEHRALLERTYAEHPDVEFVECAYLFDRTYSLHYPCTPQDEDWPILWHTTTRIVGFHCVKPEMEWILFLDADEIVEGDAMAAWLERGEMQRWNGVRFLCYYYAIRASLRATQAQELPLLAKKSALSPMIHNKDRSGLFFSMAGATKRNVRGLENKILFHHYSWVRSQEECLLKARTWAHKRDADWPTLIRAAFREQRGLSPAGIDLEFEEIALPYFDPMRIEVPTAIAGGSAARHVRHVTLSDFRQMEWNHLYTLRG